MHTNVLRKIATAVTTALLLSLMPAAAAGTQGTDAPSVERLSGPDRYATSLEVARRFVREAGGSIDAVVIVSGTSWHDAVIASALAGSLDAPVLLTPIDGLSAEAERFVVETGVQQALVVGGNRAVSEGALEKLRERLRRVERLEGANSSATSVAVAERIGTPGAMPGLGRTVVIASSEVFVDAMVAGGFAARGSHPVLLTPRSGLADEVIRYLESGDADHAVIMGGLAAVSEAVEERLESAGLRTTRLGGRTRFGTARVVAEFVEGRYRASGERCFDRSVAGLATARVPFDAFGAGPLLGKLCAPLLLSEVTRMDADTTRWLHTRTRSLVVFGGEAVIAREVLENLVRDGASGDQGSGAGFDFDNPDRSTIEGVFAEAAARRAAAITDLAANIRTGRYGVDGNRVLRGPAGFRIDLKRCPHGWSDTTGITANGIGIGHPAPLTGLLARYVDISVGMENYFDWVNKNDPILVDGTERHISLSLKDDVYVGALTSEVIAEFAAAGNIFSVLTMGGGPTVAGAKTANEKCMPHPFNLTSHPAAGDPVNRPWTTGAQMSSSTQAILWGEWIRSNLRDRLPVRVGALVAEQDEYFILHDAFLAWAEANPGVVSEFSPISHPSAVILLDKQIAAVKDSDPDVFLAMTHGPGCQGAMVSAQSNGLKADVERRGGVTFVPWSCTGETIWAQVENKPADGVMSVGRGTKFSFTGSTTEQALDEPFGRFMASNLEAAGLSPTNHLYAWGYFVAYAYVEALRIAAGLPGGLSRTNFMLAVRSLDIHHPLVLDGIRARFNGNSDAFFVEGSEFYRFDAKAGVWKRRGGIFNRNGKTPNCAWDDDNGICR